MTSNYSNALESINANLGRIADALETIAAQGAAEPEYGIDPFVAGPPLTPASPLA